MADTCVSSRPSSPHPRGARAGTIPRRPGGDVGSMAVARRHRSSPATAILTQPGRRAPAIAASRPELPVCHGGESPRFTAHKSTGPDIALSNNSTYARYGHLSVKRICQPDRAGQCGRAETEPRRQRAPGNTAIDKDHHLNQMSGAPLSGRAPCPAPPVQSLPLPAWPTCCAPAAAHASAPANTAADSTASQPTAPPEPRSAGAAGPDPPAQRRPRACARSGVGGRVVASARLQELAQRRGTRGPQHVVVDGRGQRPVPRPDLPVDLVPEGVGRVRRGWYGQRGGAGVHDRFVEIEDRGVGDQRRDALVERRRAGRLANLIPLDPSCW